MNEPSECDMATDLLYLHLHVIQSVLGQKAETKPSNRECSQGLAAMSGIGVAGLPGGMGSRLGKAAGRASALRAKSVFSASAKRSRDAVHAVSGGPTVLVQHAVTFGRGFVHLTDEVLRHTDPGGRLSVRYKPDAKGGRDVSVAGRVSPQPRLRGWQQRRSRGPRAKDRGSERQNLRVPSGPGKFMGSVSPVIKATEWPGGISSCLLAGLLRNNPEQLLWDARQLVHVRRHQHGLSHVKERETASPSGGVHSVHHQWSPGGGYRLGGGRPVRAIRTPVNIGN